MQAKGIKDHQPPLFLIVIAAPVAIAIALPLTYLIVRTAGGTPSLMRFDAFTRVIFLQYKSSFNRNLAAALALVLVGLVLTILWLEYKARSRAAYYSRGSNAQRPQAQIHLGCWRVPALLFCTVVTSFSLLLPIGITCYWLIRGLIANQAEEIRLQEVALTALNSVGAAGLAALAATICALPIAILSVRFPSRMTTMIERCSYIGFGLPGIVVALSLVFLGANYLPWLYQTLPMLVFAYLVLFLPQIVGNLRGSLLQVNPQLEESARSLGRNSWQAWKEITLPLVRPGLVTGAILVFLTAIKELPATLLLAPTGFDTLAMEIWKATENVSFSEAAVGSLAMLMVSMGSTFLVLSQERQYNS